MAGHIIIELLKTEDKGQLLKAAREKKHRTHRGTIWMTGFLIWNHGGEKEVTTFFNAERKELSTSNSIPSKNILWELWENEDTPKWRKTKNLWLENPPLKSSKRKFSKQGNGNRGGLELQKRKKNIKMDKNRGKYDRLIKKLSWVS